MISKSEKILMSLNTKQKSLCQMATTELYHKETKKRVTPGTDPASEFRGAISVIFSGQVS